RSAAGHLPTATICGMLISGMVATLFPPRLAAGPHRRRDRVPGPGRRLCLCLCRGCGLRRTYLLAVLREAVSNPVRHTRAARAGVVVHAGTAGRGGRPVPLDE
ncbi:hypothetical protein, partial [Microbispora tritici]|uniref:hypothetical protein n=1 Tax=Microbispora tritici TaxID=2604471 RepID=UPI001CA366CD